MKIKSLKLVNHHILGDLFFDFCDENGNVFNTIIIAGENGSGKSTLLKIIYEFTNFIGLNSIARNEKRTFVISLNQGEEDLIKNHENFRQYFLDDFQLSEIVFYFDFSIINNWEYMKMEFRSIDTVHNLHPSLVFNDPRLKMTFKSIFSDVEINYNPGNINAVTSKDIDEIINTSIKSSGNLATEITQLLIDVQALDDNYYGNWYRANEGKTVTVEKQNLRMQRFEEAFNSMFKHKRYKCIKNFEGGKQVLFEEHGKEIAIGDLSSGEKQIVFRGGFLLKDKKSIDGALTIIDEPEISLHPNWQTRILDYYKKLFTNENDEQTSQLIISTHSPFIIHNKSRMNDKVIVIQKLDDGSILLPEHPKFNGWTSDEEIQQAFNLNMKLEPNKHLLITEGKTDWKHLKKAFTKLVITEQLEDMGIEYLEYGDEMRMGSDELKKMCIQYSKTHQKNKMIFIFDRDEDHIIREMTEDNNCYKNWGNNVYSMVIPVPEHRKENPQVCIELYYLNKDFFKVDKSDRRLFLSNEFIAQSSRHIELDLVCAYSDELGHIIR